MEEFKEAHKFIQDIIAHPYWGRVDINWSAIFQCETLLAKQIGLSAKILENSSLFYGCRHCDTPFLIHKQKVCHECGYTVRWPQ